MTAILNHDTLEHAVVHRVAERLDHPDLPSALIRQDYDDLDRARLRRSARRSAPTSWRSPTATPPACG